MKHSIQIQNLSKTFDGINYILKDISKNIALNNIVGVVGESGTGKTTFLQILGNIMQPSSGTILVDNVNINSLPASNIGFIFQKHNLLEDISVYENVEIPLLLTNKSPKTIQYEVEQILDLFHISHVKDLYYNQISGGQSQRVAIARAMISHPKILIADEPTSSLDSNNTEIILNAMRIAKKNFNTTIIFSTHKKENLVICDDVIKF